MMYTTVTHFLMGVMGFLMGIAIFSRLATMPQTPQLIRDTSNALSRLFQGAFDLP